MNGHFGGTYRRSAACGKSAAALANDLRARLADLDRRLAGTHAAPRAFCRVDRSADFHRPRHIYRGRAARAGARSVVDTAAEWPRINLEEIVRLQPEYLVFASAHAGDTQHEIEALRTRPGWRESRRDAPWEHRRHQRCDQSARAAHGGCHRATCARVASRIVSALLSVVFRREAAPTPKTRVEEACACAR